MKNVLAYLERPNCDSGCKFDSDGKLVHCVKCSELFTLALTEAKEWAMMPTWEQKKQLEIQREQFIGEAKKSHTWTASQSYNLTRTSMSPFSSHCTKCGMTMIMFKARPEICPSK